MAINYDARVEHWKSKLLDLSTGNRLLNMAFRKTGNVARIELPDGDSLWDRLVTRELSVRFARRTRMDAESEAADYEQARDEVGEKGASLAGIKRPGSFSLKENEAVLHVLGVDQQKRLKAIRSQARSVTEERGINVLYVAIGGVRWIDQKKEQHLAPLLLVPVDLTLRSKNSLYVMARNEDDPSVNETFALKAKQDFDIDLPQLGDGEVPSQYLERVEAEVARVGWSVEPCAALGIFLFATINMYHDLVDNKSQVTANRNVRAICGDADACDATPAAADDDGQSAGDKDIPLTILDSDSSQDKAVNWANAGLSFVLQGPPGTGKSQTIANIIGESLYRGKKVLFVSEKRAALDVVKRRLDAAGLGDWAFVLHDLKSNKKEAVDSLAHQLDGLYGPMSTGMTTNDRRYKRVKADLDAYAHEVYEKIAPLGISAWDAFGEMTRLRNAPTITFSFDDTTSLDQHGLDDIRELIRGFELAILEAPAGIAEGPWRGIKLRRLTEDLADSIMGSVRRARDAHAALMGVAGRIAQVLPMDVEAIFKADGSVLLAALDACAGFACVDAVLRKSPGLDEVLAVARRVRLAAQDAASVLDGLARSLAEMGSLDSDCVLGLPDAIDREALAGLQSQLDSAVSRDALLAAIVDYPRIVPQLKELSERLATYRSKRGDILADYSREIFDLDCRGMLLRAEQGYTSWLKRLASAEFKQDVMAVSRCARQVTSKKMGYEQLKDVLHQLDEVRAEHAVIEESLAMLAEEAPDAHLDFDADLDGLDRSCKLALLVKSAAGQIDELDRVCGTVTDELHLISTYPCFEYRGLRTELADIDDVQGLLDSVRTAAVDLGCDPENMLAAPACRDIPSRHVESMREEYVAASKDWDEARAELLSFFKDDAAVASMAPNGISELLASCIAHERDLGCAVTYERRVEECRKAGLGEFVSAVEKTGIDAHTIWPAFERRFYTLWFEQACERLPTVVDFIEAEQAHRIEDFGKLDVYELGRASTRIVASLRKLAAKRISDTDVRILRHEAGKSKRIKPVRKLMEEIPDLIVALKPCMMMSPLSVCTFLKARTIDFDLVIFDEGSQVRTEYAIGAISRGEQIIIGGDSKQLPPSSFFTAGSSGDDDLDAPDEDAVVDEFDSVLDEASMMPTTTLRWHYRSRNESLIAFSNKEIYNGDLVTFPSGREGAAGEGVSFVHVPHGIWEGSRDGNPIEAQRVAELVLEHYEQYPDRSLGVIAFGSGQMNAIEAALTGLRKTHDRYERFFDEDVSEPFFIKSLENVQGDERDSIILSVGYARSSAGVFAMRFGPIGQAGGERRLNVAVTRAKRSLTLVSSVTELDFNLPEEAKRGPSLLRDYIAFARRCEAGSLGTAAAVETQERERGIQSETPLMDYLVQVVEGLGLVAVREVGETKNRVDVGVKAQPDDARYIAGIVMDGPSYHAAHSTRERDRIRPSMLSGMGWKLYNVWAPAWGRNPVGEADRLQAFLREAAAEHERAEGDSAGAGARDDLAAEEANGGADGSEPIPEASLAGAANPKERDGIGGEVAKTAGADLLERQLELIRRDEEYQKSTLRSRRIEGEPTATAGASSAGAHASAPAATGTGRRRGAQDGGPKKAM